MDESVEKERMKWRMIGCGVDKPLKPQTIQCDFFAEFMRRRFPHANETYALEWARRFARGEEFHFSDEKSRQVLLDIMVHGTGGGNMPHLNKKDINYLCERYK